MKTVIAQVKATLSSVYGSTASPSGSFDTSARPDAQAALIRNLIWPSGTVGRDWSINHAGTPEDYPQVTDQPTR
jgi:hypothetical protein